MSSPVEPASAGSRVAPIGARREPDDPWEVVEGSDPVAWDRDIVASGRAHPLQVWAWGEARESRGDRLVRLRIARGTDPVLLAQVILQRRTPLGLPVAWIARGPVWREAPPHIWGQAAALLGRALAARGAWLLVARHSVEGVGPPLGWHIPWERGTWSFQLDLTQPLDVLDRGLHREWRYGKNRFHREGGQVVEADEQSDLDGFIAMRDATARRKSINAYGDAAFLRAVWEAFRRRQSTQVSAHMFQARIAGRSLAAAVVLRVGCNAHYMWGAFDYEARNLRVTEGLQWGIIEHLRSIGVSRYDLEGADPRSAPGVFEFKKRMGGDLVRMPRTVWAPLITR